MGRNVSVDDKEEVKRLERWSPRSLGAEGTGPAYLIEVVRMISAGTKSPKDAITLDRIHGFCFGL